MEMKSNEDHEPGKFRASQIPLVLRAAIMVGVLVLLAAAALQSRTLASVGGLLVVTPLALIHWVARSAGVSDVVETLIVASVSGAVATSMTLIVMPTWTGLAASLLAISLVAAGWAVIGEQPEVNPNEGWRRVSVVMGYGALGLILFALVHAGLPLTAERIDGRMFSLRARHAGGSTLFGAVSLLLCTIGVLSREKRRRQVLSAAALACTTLGVLVLLT